MTVATLLLMELAQKNRKVEIGTVIETIPLALFFKVII